MRFGARLRKLAGRLDEVHNRQLVRERPVQRARLASQDADSGWLTL